MSCMTDTLGAELEYPSAEHASRVLVKAGWKPDHAVRQLSETTYPNQQAKTASIESLNCFNSIFSSINGFLELFKNISIASAATKILLERIPSDSNGINSFFVKHLGFVPFYIQKISSIPVRRTLAYNLHLLILTNPEDLPESEAHNRGSIRAKDRIILAYIYFASAQNWYMAAHMATTAKLKNVTYSEIQEQFETGTRFIPVPLDSKRPLLDHLAMVSYLTARRDRRNLFKLAPQIFEVSGNSPEVCLEFVALLSFCSLLQRLTTALCGNFVYEKEVEELVSSHYGKSLGLEVGKQPIYSNELFTETTLWGGK
ncbi:hypothetical protein HK096_004677, partial [Nowakowskiella sp. JEL0078]